MNYNIPIIYKLDIREFTNNYDIYLKELKIDNFKLLINKNNIIYNISSDIKLEFLLDFLINYDNIIIKKIYYFLIIKHLLNKKYYIYNNFCNCFNNDIYDIYLKTREYKIGHDKTNIIITDILIYNICLIIINKTILKYFICIIDKNCLILYLYDILINNIYNSNNYEDIEIIIIGGSIDNVNIIINIYNILRNLRLSKFIKKTFLFKKKPLNRIKFNSHNNKITFINNYNDNSKYLNNPMFYSNLHRIN